MDENKGFFVYLNMDIFERKRAIRRAISELKGGVDTEWKIQMSDIILSRLEEMESFKSSDSVLIYHALPDEVQTAAFLDRWCDAKQIVIPLVKGNDLILKKYDRFKIVPGYKGIPEPTDDAITILPSEIDLAVIPGVAFDRCCNRLGRGKGFYDRLIPSLKCPLIGLGFDFQVVDQVPVEIFDRKLDMVITQSNLFYR